MVLAIDPGTEQSAYVFWDGKNIGAHNIVPNVALLGLLRTLPHDGITLLIEQIRSYGMAVGATTLDTVHWSGRFDEAWSARGGEVVLMPRVDVKMFWCKAAKASDANVWQAMRDRFGEVGTKKNPNPVLYGVKSHERAALALAIAFSEGETK